MFLLQVAEGLPLSQGGVPVPVEDYAYDGEGNRTSRTSKTTGDVESYTYDSQNRLIGYTSPTTTAIYAYDALDRRISKVVDGVTEAFIYDSWGLLSTTSSDVVMDFEGGVLVRRWQHGPGADEPLGLYAVSGTGGTPRIVTVWR